MANVDDLLADLLGDEEVPDAAVEVRAGRQSRINWGSGGVGWGGEHACRAPLTCLLSLACTSITRFHIWQRLQRQQRGLLGRCMGCGLHSCWMWRSLLVCMQP